MKLVMVITKMVNGHGQDEDGHGLVDLTAFNTDGFAVSGANNPFDIECE